MDAVPTFEEIRSFFRDTDREEMRWAFDLWNAADLRANAAAILDRIEAGDMPCDDKWPEYRILTLRRWLAAGGPL